MTERHPAPVLALTIELAGFGAVSIARSNVRYWAFLVIITILAGTLAIVDERVRFTRGAMWMLVALGGLHLAGGLLPPMDGPTFYETWLVSGVLKFDQVVHLFGSSVATLLAWQILGCYVDPERTDVRTQALIAAFFALGKGALNEVIEFMLASTSARIFAGTVVNTEWDLMFNAAGAFATMMFLRSGAYDRHVGVHERGSDGKPARVIGISL